MTYFRYATQKTIATGFLNVTLITTNFSDMKKMIDSNRWSAPDIVTFSVICLSLCIQVAIAILLIRLGKSREITDANQQNLRRARRSAGLEDKKIELPSANNVVTLLTALISVLNIFVSIFSAS